MVNNFKIWNNSLEWLGQCSLHIVLNIRLWNKQSRGATTASPNNVISLTLFGNIHNILIENLLIYKVSQSQYQATHNHQTYRNIFQVSYQATFNGNVRYFVEELVGIVFFFNWKLREHKSSFLLYKFSMFVT